MCPIEDFKFDFEKLIVYQKALEFIHEIISIYRKLPQDFKYTIGANLVRASISIANNLAEGSGKRFKREKARYYCISLDSARECASVFNILKMESLVDKDKYHQSRVEIKEITSMINGLLNSLR
ncbi:MAG: four helix bundle protein [Candidatus Omnitrophica bacterium]|nr:four helix bundle protein [Candidatus Omnitrophota bacterium]